MHEYFIEQKIEAGIKLQGSEVKSVRAGKVNINDAYVTFKNSEAYLLNMHISKYEQSAIFNHDETRTRKLLLHKHEINKLFGLKREKSFTVIPLKVYLKEGLVKIEIALAKGKKLYDKRDAMREKDLKRYAQKHLKGIQ